MRRTTTPTTIHTADGSSVTISRRGIMYDLETRNARGETISTVEMGQADLDRLYREMGDAGAVDDAIEDAYQAGYRDGQEAA
ncbi:hypothetical protein ACFUGD_01325 [Streptomyces sp. NPDC057217]|uniref:hypothetical protein n=1 Tax=Streptomyces sp. NPDC057217 TaxID=3346054 RepID=UPI003625F849